MSSLLKKFQLRTIIALILFFIISISLGMATYSWYTISTAPQVRAVETYMKVIDPVLSIARATDETTEPQEVSNEDAAARNDLNSSNQKANELYDTTWGTIVDSFQNTMIGIDGQAYDVDNGYFKLDYPATYTSENPSDEDVDEELAELIDTDTLNEEAFPHLLTASIGEDGRLGKLEFLKENDLGQELDGTYKNHGIRYYTSRDGRVCAVGLGVWLRINQEDHDLVASISGLKIKLADGTDVLNGDNIKVGIRVLNDETAPAAGGEPIDRQQLLMTHYTEASDSHTAIIYDSDGATGAFPANTPKLVEMVIYMEGNTNSNDGSETSAEQTGVLAKDVNQTLYLNIESVTFFDNISIVADQIEDGESESETGTPSETGTEAQTEAKG